MGLSELTHLDRVLPRSRNRVLLQYRCKSVVMNRGIENLSTFDSENTYVATFVASVCFWSSAMNRSVYAPYSRVILDIVASSIELLSARSWEAT